METEIEFKITAEKLTPYLKEEVQRALVAGAFKIEERAKLLVPVDMGHLRASIHHLVKDWNSILVGAGGQSASYAGAIEFGTVPHTPPFDAIAEWARRKGIPEAAWPIWQTIREKGTQPHPYMRPAIHSYRDWIQERIREASITAMKKSELPD